MPVKTDTSKTEEESFANKLAKAGFEDFYIIDSENARKLLTEKRREMIRELRETEPSSIRGLARNLERDIKQVKEDLDVLTEFSLIEYEEDRNRKKPKLKHEKIFIKPL